MSVFGTRPEALKMAPLILAMRAADDIEPVVVVSGQHREMLDTVLDLFDIRPDVDLDVMQDRQDLASTTARVLERLSPAVEASRPDMIAVQGDTTSTFVGALVGFYHQIPVAHVEAGLRTGNVRAPYPEEMNRRLTSGLTDLHLAPTPSARDNLISEGVPTDRIVVTGNTIIDTLLHAVEMHCAYDDPALADLDSDDSPVLLVTIHRREARGTAMTQMARALADIARAEPRLRIVFPIHLNPVVRDAFVPVLRGLRNVQLIEPMAYGGFVRLMQRSTLVLTDSGGIQEEAPSLGKPVLVARETTERPEAVAAGTARLVGVDGDRIRDEVLHLLHDRDAYASMANAVNPYGDGHAAARCLDAMRWHLARTAL